MFIINITYIKPLTDIDFYLKDHIAWLEKCYESGYFVASGRKKPRTGGVILANAVDENKIYEIIEEDPFNKAHLATYDIIEFQVTKTNNQQIHEE
jgi:uncharacterized protein YciI